MTCPECGSEDCTRVIAFALPMSFCLKCNSLWGFFSSFYAFVIAPIEMSLNGHSAFMAYNCGYWEALWVWLTTGPENDDK